MDRWIDGLMDIGDGVSHARRSGEVGGYLYISLGTSLGRSDASGASGPGGGFPPLQKSKIKKSCAAAQLFLIFDFC